MQTSGCDHLLSLLPWLVRHLLEWTQNFEYGRPSLGGCCRDSFPFVAVLQPVGFVRVVSAAAPAFHVGGECRKNCADLGLDSGIGKRQLCEGLARLGDLSSQIVGASGLLAGPRGTL